MEESTPVKGMPAVNNLDDVLPLFSEKLKKDEKIKYSNEDLMGTMRFLLEEEEEEEESSGIRSIIGKVKSVASYPAPYVFAQFAKMAYKNLGEDWERDLPE